MSNVPVLIYQLEQTVAVAQAQCDCACSTTQPRRGFDHIWHPDVPYHLHPSYISLPLTEDFTVGLCPLSPAAVLNTAAAQVVEQFRQPHRLNEICSAGRMPADHDGIEHLIHQLAMLGLLVPADRAASSINETVSTLTAWLHLTDRCNLRCAYCYLPHVRADMPLETGRAAIDAVVRSALAHGYERIKLKYAGGEPLLRCAAITELHRYAQAAAAKHNLALDGIVLTNGTLLTPDIVGALRALNLRLMISLDGLGQFHDEQRPYAGGRESANDVIAAIETAQQHGLTPDISITVSGRSVDGLPQLIAWVLERQLPFSINFYRENDLTRSRADLALEEQQIIAAMHKVFQVIEANLPPRSILGSLVDRANLAAAHTHTCGVGRSYLVFDYRGRVVQCQMHMTHIVTTADADDPLGLVRADRNGIQNVSVDAKTGCQSCAWKYWCTGGCALATFRATGRYDVQSPNCAIYKALYPEVIRLEGLRLLKYAAPVMAS